LKDEDAAHVESGSPFGSSPSRMLRDVSRRATTKLDEVVFACGFSPANYRLTDKSIEHLHWMDR